MILAALWIPSNLLRPIWMGRSLNGKGELDPAFFPLFREVQLRGIGFTAASGRQYDGLLRTFAPVADRMLFIAENGAYAAAGRRNRCFWTWIMKR